MALSPGVDLTVMKGKTMVRKRTYRSDQSGRHEREYDKNRRLILSRDEVCAICGQPVDRHFKFPHPMSASVDHIIPVSKGGHPSAISNLQLTHLICNQIKGTKLVIEENKIKKDESKPISNRDFPHAFDWINYRSE